MAAIVQLVTIDSLRCSAWRLRGPFVTPRDACRVTAPVELERRAWFDLPTCAGPVTAVERERCACRNLQVRVVTAGS